MSDEKQAPAERKVTITLTGDHTHAGRKYKAGAKLEVEERYALRIAKLGKCSTPGGLTLPQP